MKVLVTGAHGFVGRHLVKALDKAGHEVIGTVRRDAGSLPCLRLVPEGSSHEAELLGCDVLVHTGGLAHRPSAGADEFERINRDWTHRLAREAADAGVRTVIHISSIAARDAEAGRGTAYGVSKREAEDAVAELARSGILAINLRPPLIYGPGAPGNWEKLLRLARAPVPLPFAAVRNRRSYLGIGNLCSAIAAILEVSAAPRGAGDHGLPRPFSTCGSYALADLETLSLGEVLSILRAALGRPPMLFSFPPRAIAAALRRIGKEAMADGLFGDLILDSTPFRDHFGWSPPYPTARGMAESILALP
jgi:UDP-glucose 4-epimerase